MTDTHKAAVVWGNGLNAYSIVKSLYALEFEGSIYLAKHRDAVFDYADVLAVKESRIVLNRCTTHDLLEKIEHACGQTDIVYLFLTDERFHAELAELIKSGDLPHNIVVSLGCAEAMPKVLDRFQFYAYIEKIQPGITPKTIEASNDPFPVFGEKFVVRPRESWLGGGQRARVQIVDGADSFEKAIQKCLSQGMKTEQWCYQQLLSTQDTHNVSVCGWYGENNIHLCCTRKVLQHPPEQGDGDVVEIVNDPGGLLDVTKKILGGLKYVGPFELEFVYDQTAGAYKIIELNPRFWLQHELIEKRFGHALVANCLNCKPREENASVKCWVHTPYAWVRAVNLDFRGMIFALKSNAVMPLTLFHAVLIIPKVIWRRVFKRCNRTVLQLTSAHTLRDERILHRMARSLGESGYPVTVMAPYDKDGSSPLPTNYDGVSFQLLQGKSGSPEILDKRWKRTIRALKYAVFSNTSIVHVHDPDLLLFAPLIRLFGKKVVYDIHDDYEASLKARLFKNKIRAVLMPKIWRYAERFCMKFLNGLIVADRHLEAKFKKYNPVVLGNYPRRDFVDGNKERETTTFDLVYAGDLSVARGLECMAEVIQLLNMDDLCFHIIGQGRDHALIKRLKSDSHNQMYGRIEWTKLKDIYRIADIGIALYQPLASFTYYTGENAVKILEYMAAGIPVVTANFPGLKAFVEDQECGICVQPDDPRAVADVIERLYYDPDLRKRLGQNGRRLFEETYNWEHHEGKLIRLYEQVCNGV